MRDHNLLIISYILRTTWGQQMTKTEMDENKKRLNSSGDFVCVCMTFSHVWVISQSCVSMCLFYG